MSAPDVVLTFYTASGRVQTFDWPDGWPMPRLGEYVFANDEGLRVHSVNWSPNSGSVDVRCISLEAEMRMARTGSEPGSLR